MSKEKKVTYSHDNPVGALFLNSTVGQFGINTMGLNLQNGYSVLLKLPSVAMFCSWLDKVTVPLENCQIIMYYNYDYRNTPEQIEARIRGYCNNPKNGVLSLNIYGCYGCSFLIIEYANQAPNTDLSSAKELLGVTPRYLGTLADLNEPISIAKVLSGGIQRYNPDYRYDYEKGRNIYEYGGDASSIALLAQNIEMAIGVFDCNRGKVCRSGDVTYIKDSLDFTKLLYLTDASYLGFETSTFPFKEFFVSQG